MWIVRILLTRLLMEMKTREFGKGSLGITKPCAADSWVNSWWTRLSTRWGFKAAECVTWILLVALRLTVRNGSIKKQLSAIENFHLDLRMRFFLFLFFRSLSHHGHAKAPKNTFLLLVRAMAPLKASAVHTGYLNLDNVHMLLILKEREMCCINECSPRILKSLCWEVCCRRVPWWTFWCVMRGAVRKAKVRREDLVKTDICNSSWEKPQRTKSAGSWRAWSWANATGEKLSKSLGSHTPPELPRCQTWRFWL